MRKPAYTLLISAAIAASSVLLLTACNRQDKATEGAIAPAKTTVGTEIDDTVITTKVRSALLGDKDVKDIDIKVETRKGTTMLSGFVDSQGQIDRVLNLTRAIEGVKAVENGMSVKEGKSSLGNKVDDSVITTRIKSAFLADPAIKSIDVRVTTRKGEVQLSGFVDSQAQIDQAMAIARRTEDVQGVVSEMSIKK